MHKQQLIEYLSLLKSPKTEYCLFGGACLAIRDLRPTDDIDLFATQKLYEELKNNGWREVEEIGLSPYLSIRLNGMQFEAHAKFNNKNWQPDIKQYLSHPEIIENYPFMPLTDLYEWKSITRRSKDVSDMKLIEDYWAWQNCYDDTVKQNKILIIGGGGREHALAWKLGQSPHVGKVFVAPGNGGTASVAENVDIGFIDIQVLLKFALTNKIDLTVIGPEAASDAGVADAFQAAGLVIFSPTKAATQIESSKAFSKDLMKQQQIPTARYEVFSDTKKALDYLKTAQFPLVIKADGLADGKGVVICPDIAKAQTVIENIMQNRVLKEAGSQVVIEEFLVGQEISIHALHDGKYTTLFPPSQDYKQIFDGDVGPNTGGIGVIAPVEWVSSELLVEVEKKIIQPALQGMNQKGIPFQGCLYPGLMVDGDNINVVEFNARFGDPEAEVYMRLLESDLFELLDNCARGQLSATSLKWKPGVAICVTLCSAGYPGNSPKGLPITGLAELEKMDDIVVFHSGTKKDEIGYKTNGGRVLHVTATGGSISGARAKVYKAIKKIHFEGMHCRTDIGLRKSG